MTEAPVVTRFRSALSSPLSGVSAAAWARLLSVLEQQQLPDGRWVIRSIGAVSPSGGLGSYDLRCRRLVEIGLGEHLRYVRNASGRQIHTCDLVSPYTRAAFLSNPVTQYMALSRSMVRYHQAIQAGEIKKPEEASLAGALVILHRGGRGALVQFPDLFPETRALYERAQGAF